MKSENQVARAQGPDTNIKCKNQFNGFRSAEEYDAIFKYTDKVLSADFPPIDTLAVYRTDRGELEFAVNGLKIFMADFDEVQRNHADWMDRVKKFIDWDVAGIVEEQCINETF